VTKHDAPKRGAHLPIHTRRVLSGDGDVEVSRSVHCDRRGGHVPLEDCLLCDDCEGIEETSDGRRRLACLGPTQSDRSSQPWRVPRDAHGNAAITPISQVMTPSVLCVRADVSVETVASLLLEHGISAVPVVDESGRPIGVLSNTDLVREAQDNRGEIPTERLPRGFHMESLGRRTAGDAMTPLVFALPEMAPVGKAAALMVYERVHRTPVLGKDGRIVGILSSSDVLRWLARESGFAMQGDPVPTKEDDD
jgi:CBS domain-containing protein